MKTLWSVVGCKSGGREANRQNAWHPWQPRGTPTPASEVHVKSDVNRHPFQVRDQIGRSEQLSGEQPGGRREQDPVGLTVD